MPFLFDYGVHARALFAMPLLIVVEVVVGPRLGGAAAQFLARGLVKPEEHGRFEAAVAQALRIRDSAVLEVAVLVLAYVGSFVSLGLALLVPGLEVGSAGHGERPAHHDRRDLEHLRGGPALPVPGLPVAR